MKRSTLLFIALGLFAAVAAADDKITWKIPTARTDGAALAVTEIAGYRLFVDDVLIADNIPATSTTITVSVNPGKRVFKMQTVDKDGREGPFSAPVSADIKGPPNAPVILTIEFVK